MAKERASQPKMPHDGRYNHLCYLVNINYHSFNPEQYKSIVRDAKFICKVCGRVANKAKNLCRPVKL